MSPDLSADMSATAGTVVSTAWLLYVLLVGTLLALGARALATALGGAGRPTRWLWVAALGGTLGLAIAAPERTTVRIVAQVGGPATAPVPTAAVAPRSARWGDRVERLRGELASATTDALARVDARLPAADVRLVVIGWSILTALLLALYLIVNVRMARARRGWPRHRLLGVGVRVAPETGPAVIGLMPAEIVVPRSLLRRGSEEQRLILTHEREHLRAHDHLLLGAAWMTAILLPWHPAVWYILARLRLAIELDCDARVLRQGVAPGMYGTLLIDMAEQGSGIRIGALALTDGTTHLERRLRAMKRSRSRHALARGGALCVLAGALVMAACEAKIPTAAEIDALDVAGATKSATKAGLTEERELASADYFVDGVKVSSAAARALDGSQIGSITVVKRRDAAGTDTILVTTMARMPRTDGAAKSSGSPTLSGPNAPNFVIDGAAASPAAFAKLDPATIVQIAVRKSKAGHTDPANPNGLVHVTTTAAKERAPEVRTIRETFRAELRMPPSQPSMVYTVDGVAIRPSLADPTAGGRVGWDPKAGPAYTIDGAPATRDEFTRLPREHIVAINVVKVGATALSKDPAAVNGLVQITTRNGKKQ